PLCSAQSPKNIAALNTIDQAPHLRRRDPGLPTLEQETCVSEAMKPHRGPLILVLGILGLIMCPPLGIAAWFMADSDFEKMKNGNMDSAGRDLTKAGRILGIIGTIY